MKKIFENVFEASNWICTKSMIPGFRVKNESTFKEKGIEYRVWDPNHSKLSAAIKKGLLDLPIKPGSNVLYLGAAQGVTPSFVSDIVGRKGFVYCVEFSKVAMQRLIPVCEKRENMAPILADARKPEEYEEVGKVDVVFEDVADRDQTRIMIENSRFLEDGGHALLALKSQSIDSTVDPKKTYAKAKRELQEKFELIQELDLNPFEKDHEFYHLKKI
ncbi:MAG: fibrillarin-like rRNA/tRNA 2'-O-methyltransferase [Candidatus Micrarchaeota archaeon]